MSATRTLPYLVIAASLLVAACGPSKKIDEEKSASLIQPVSSFELKVVKVEPGKRTGEEIYKVCSGCHASGSLGAPKTGDKAAWAPRIAMGFDALVKSATAGKNSMPPKGGVADLTDKEVARAVAYIANQGGASFTAPPVE